MNCFYHTSETAVASCQDCNKGLCPDCASLYDIPICRDCNHKRINIEKRGIVKELMITLAAGLLLVVYFIFMAGDEFHKDFSGLSKPLAYIILMYLGGSLVAGWKTLTAITPNVFLFLPIIGWVIFFIIKLTAAWFIGPFMLPIRWIRKALRWKTLKKIEAIA